MTLCDPKAAQRDRPARMVVCCVDPGSATFHELCRFRGALFEEWVALWRGLAVMDKDPYSHPAWVLSWMQTAPPEQQSRMRLVCVRDGERLAAVLPFVARQGRIPLGPRGWFSLPFVRNRMHQAAPSVARRDQAAVLQAVFEARVHQGRRPAMLHFGCLTRDHTVLNTGWPSMVVSKRGRLALHAEDGYDAMIARMRRKARRNIRHARRRMEALPELSFTTYRSPETIPEALERFITLERSGWKGRDGNAIAKDPAELEFTRTMVRGLAVCGNVAIRLLTSGTELLGGLISYEHDDVLCHYKVAYSEAFRGISPGHMVFDLSFRELCRDGRIREVDLVSDAAWAQVWAPKLIARCEALFFAPGLRGWWARLMLVPGRIRLIRMFEYLGVMGPVRRLWALYNERSRARGFSDHSAADASPPPECTQSPGHQAVCEA